MSESETIYSENVLSENERAYNTSDEKYLPPNKKTKKMEINIKSEK